MAVSIGPAAHAVDAFVLPSGVAAILEQRCTDCHSGDLSEGDVRLDALAELELDARLDLLNRAQEQLFLRRMPPEDEAQPTADERSQLADWVSQELHKYNASKFEKKLQEPEFGNYVDHDQLFSGKYKDLPGFTYDRRWLISEYIFNAKFQRILQGTTRAKRNGMAVTVVGGHRFCDFSLTNPFLLPERSGVRYYADTDLTGGHLLSMLTNAQKTSQYMTENLAKRNPKYLPAIGEVMALEDQHHATLAILREYIADFRAHLDDKTRSRHQAPDDQPLNDGEMEVIQAAILKHRQAGDFYLDVIDKCLAQWESEFQQARVEAGPPAEELLRQLVDELFVQILQRSPAAAETEEYVALTNNYITKLGNLKAIQKLIQTLILSSEFVYRQEFGTGEPDEHGRRMLSPRDASYAIAYALTDQSPDEELFAAAASGQLKTREDYRREVTRILQQRDVYYLIDPILADKNFQDNTTDTAIRKLRFFREFFGYPKAITVFKDEKRFGGDRLGNAMSRLLSETDRIVEHILEKDAQHRPGQLGRGEPAGPDDRSIQDVDDDDRRPTG